MATYIVRRLLIGVLILIMVTVLVFIVMRFLPGDPLMLYVSQSDVNVASPEQLEKLRLEFGLDKSFPMQYIDWIGGVLRGDLGVSVFYRQSVSYLFSKRLPITIYLGVLAFIISSILGVIFGTTCALRRGKKIDAVITVLANIGITVPSFWVGILLIYLFSLKLGWLPTSGYTSPFQDFWLSLRRVIMPVFCLSLFSIASLTRQSRSSVLEVIGMDYVRTAWAKGLRERAIVLKHIIKNAMIPVITILGVQVSLIFGGSVLIETIFNIPGMGRLLTEAVFGHDYQVVQGGVLIIALIIVLTNLLVDISYGWFDPRIRYG
ncbi:MAG: peptide ABC transporter [Chloroflexi bacterium RBG_16_50_9]|nr:MAG: peptide ABC transporter [Chloroflexi bacterium RBG_16_50_9]